MTIAASDGFSGPYTANGVTTAFPFTFQVLSTGQVAVVLRAADGTETAVNPVLYTTSLTGAAPSAGTVTFLTAPTTGNAVVIHLDPEFEQAATFEDGSAWLAKPVNDGYDQLALQTQALRRDADRAFKVPMEEVAPDFRAMGSATDGAILGYVGATDDWRPLDNSVWEGWRDQAIIDVGAEVDAKLALAETAATTATNAAAAFTFEMGFYRENAAGVEQALYEGTVSSPYALTATRFFAEVRAGTGTADVTVIVNGVHAYGPITVGTTATDDVVSIAVPQYSDVQFAAENVDATVTALFAKIEGTPA